MYNKINVEMSTYEIWASMNNTEGDGALFTAKATVHIDIPDSFLDDILTTAFEGGSNYWLDSVSIKDKPDTPHKNLYNSEIISMGGALYCDSEDNGRAVLTKGKLLKAVQWFIETSIEGQNNLRVLDDHDAQDSDTILQYALFGEVVYG